MTEKKGPNRLAKARQRQMEEEELKQVDKELRTGVPEDEIAGNPVDPEHAPKQVRGGPKVVRR